MVQKTRIRTIELLPEIFQTATNEQFLSATLDQLIQDPKLKQTQGFIGRRVGPGVNPNDNYVLEPTRTRADYQLEPGVCWLQPNTNIVEDALTYPGMIDSIAVKGGNVNRGDRLFTSDYYSWDPFVDFDKFVNFSQYYWLPGGPDSVDVFADPVPLTDNFTVTRNTNDYTFSGVAGTNPTITLARQGSYTFDVQQTGHKFWIQAVPGVSGTMPQTPNQSSREVLGVENNGDDNGTITFNVPEKSAQNFYYTLADGGSVDFATDIPFDQINNVYYSEFIEKYHGIDGITDLDGRTLIFLGNSGWFYTGLYDSAGQPYDSTAFDQTVEIALNSQRYSVWRINLVYEDSENPFIKLTVANPVANLTRLLINYGTAYSNISFYKNSSGFFERIPLITADRDILYYQDADNPSMFGIIQLIDQPTDVDIIVENVYIPAVSLTNSIIRNNTLTFGAATGGQLLPGMILSGGNVTEGTYLVSKLGDNEWLLNQHASGAPTTAQIVNIVGSRYYTSPNGVVFTNGLKVQFEGPTIPASYSGNAYYVEGVGTSIQLLPVEDFVTPEQYTRSGTVPYDSVPYDTTPYDETLNAPLDPDYLTINRASQDLNAWTRSNRWFHVEVINATAKYNNQIAQLDNNYRAKRPIIEFESDLKLFNYGTIGVVPVNIIDFRATDAMSNINGTIGYSIDGYSFQDGTRVIFAGDRDPEVRNKIFQVTFIQPSGSGTPVIDLQPADLNKPDVLYNQCVVITSGITEQGRSYWFNGVTWQLAQLKTDINQAPLFDVFDVNGVSFSDTVVYPSTNFIGTKLFSYAVGEGVSDSIIGQPLKYLTINNVGDIVFDNNLYIDQFIYVKDTLSVTVPINSGVIRRYTSREDFVKLLGWQTAYTETVSRQNFTFVYTSGQPLVLDIPVDVTASAIPVKVFANGIFIDPTTYTYVVNANNSTTITFNSAPPNGTSIEVSVISDVPSPTGFYSVPVNLENNAVNSDVTELTLGTIRNHYSTICQNLSTFSGEINGQNNTRDLGNLIPYGQVILQQSSPLTLAGTFVNNPGYDFFRAVEFAAREYEKYKNLIMDAVVKNNFQNMTPAAILDECITLINLGKNELAPFYWTDTIPCGDTFEQTQVTVTPITTNTFDTLYSYDFTQANYRGILVYVNDQILLGNSIDYEVATDGPRLTVLIPLSLGDVVTIREYVTTYANFVPSTPTVLNLYPSSVPRMFLDDTYVEPTMVIQGHDGSLTVAYNDIRDAVLLEFEKRIYNNLKTQDNPIPLTAADVVPGQFRTTDYSLAEITSILGTSFLAWVGTNKLPYKDQDYIANNQFTWNYSSSANKLSDKPLLGAWRGIYNYFYDTDAPNTRPWEMLGFAQEPTWWQDYYGPAPYTSGNTVLWDDLEAGRVQDPAGTYILSQYARPGLNQVIPSGSEGELLSPFEVVVGDYDQGTFRKSWTVGDDGSVEASWRKSSNYPFAIMRLLALTRPAEFFSLFADRDAYKYNQDFEQYVYDGRFRIQPSQLQIYGNGTIVNSYINWIVDYNRQTGLDSTKDLKVVLENLDVRLCYRMASFSDKSYIKIYTEKSSPNSLNTSLLLPDESYQLLLYENPTVETLTWSSVIIQKTNLGYAVYGYSTTRPYFDITVSVPNGNYKTITVSDTAVRAPADFSNTVIQVPYGYEFVSINSVVDFLLSYGNFLERQGMTFIDKDRARTLNWSQMAEEFVYWSQQGWAPGSLININPAANVLNVVKANLVAEPLSVTAPEDILLNQNKQSLQSQDFVVERFGNDFTLRAVNNNTFSYMNAKFTQFEHLIVFDNTSVFNDLIYNPATGARQSRLLFTGYTTYDWNGTLDAQGFILNQDNIQAWRPNTNYSKGQIVRYKDTYWAAVKIIPPQETFDFQYWLKSDYDQIQKGLLPNAAQNAEQIRNFYDTRAANLEKDADLFAFGLIGFRPRRYMQNLNLDDISQVNLYQNFIGVKGTTQATDLFTQANLGKETGEYEIFENWAIQRAVYGANANRSFFELRLNEANLLGNPSTIQIINPDEFSLADQTVLVNNIWKESYKITSPDILPTTFLNTADLQLPSAGYVNWDDADIKIFNFSDLGPIINDIENITVGTSIWVAKDNSYNWNIYRTNLVVHDIIEVRDNLNGTCTLTFAGQHGLGVNQKIVVKYFGTGVDGAYSILSVPSLKTITVALTLGGAITTATGIGLCFVLETMRVAQASDVANLNYANSLLAGNRAWVDDDGTGHWTVYEKINPFSAGISITPQEPVISSRFGSSISQGFGNLGALIGAPGYNGEVGAVYGFAKSDTGQYVEINAISQNVTNLTNLGTSVHAGGSNWGVSGAPTSWANQGYGLVIYRSPETGAYIPSQLLAEVPHNIYQATGDGSTVNFNPTGVVMTDLSLVGIMIDDVVQVLGTDWSYSSPNVTFTTAPVDGASISIFNYDEYGYDVTVSRDERWMYVGAPAANRFYIYNYVDVQTQVKQFTGDGSTNEFYIADTIIVDDDSTDGGAGAQQIGVLVNNIPRASNLWTYIDGAVVFNTAPNTGDVVRITRKQSVTYFPTTPGNEFSVDELYTVTDIYSMTVYVNDVLQRPNMDYTYNSTTKKLNFVSGSVTGTVLIVSESYWAPVGYFSMPTPVIGARFGHSIDTTTDGRQILVGTPDATVDGLALAGEVYMIDRSVERFTVVDPSVTEYETLRNFNGPASVKVNATYLIPDGFNNNGQFTEVNANTVNITAPLNVGDIIEIDTNTFALMQIIQSNQPQADASFGRGLQMCPTNCSLYVGQPNDSRVLPEAGSVERFLNQNRVYGTITGTQQDPTLTPGDTVRINNVDIAVPTPDVWNSALTYTAGSFVISGVDIYQARLPVPAGESIADTTYWLPSDWVSLYANTINVAAQPDPTTGLLLLPNVQAISANGYLTLSITNASAAIPLSQLLVLPGLGSAYTAIGFEPQAWTQTIEAPGQIAYAHFGSSVSISNDSETLAVGSPQGTAYEPTTFDSGDTYFDSKATDFFDPLNESGVAYTYDLLLAANGSIDNPSKFVFGIQLYDQDINSLDLFGKAVDIGSGVLLIGSPQDDLGDSVGDYGRISQFNNPELAPAWAPIYRQQPIVDVYLLNSVLTYDRLENRTSQFYDFIDPLQGKILGVARENIDYIAPNDPANYNVGPINNFGDTWNDTHLGEIWWDVTTTRFIDYHQSTIEYASRRWSQLFPGSTVDVYQWVESTVPPAEYTGPGTVRDTVSYVVSSKLNNEGLFASRYFFWVKDIREVASRLNKTLSVQAISQYIENPRGSGIPYIAALSPSTLALYNARPYISAQDTILRVEFDRIANADNVHVEYDLVAALNPDSFISAGLYRKMLDSFCGEDTVGNKVPDTNLSPADRYGVQFRPRQSMFVDRYLALKNYLQRANAIVALYAISDSKPFTLLNSSEPEPTEASGQWNKRVATYQELTYQDINAVPLGYKYLVVSDVTVQGLWTIYTVDTELDGITRRLLLSRVQNYDTKLYWEYINWVKPGYNATIKPVAEVRYFNDLQQLDVPNGSSAKVTKNSFGKYEIYQYNSETDTWTRVVLEDGTIRIKETIWDYAVGNFGFDVETFDAQRFDQYPAIETRQIINAFNEEIFTDQLKIYRNELLMLVFEFILQEQLAPEWLFKTSLIDVNHMIRELLPYQIFRQDNQDFVLDYIKEVKPYHVKIKEFNLKYSGLDTYMGNLTDFDVPAYYDPTSQSPTGFLSPILDDDGNIDSYASTLSTSAIWQTWPYSQWFQNYKLLLDSVTIIDGGNFYTVPPVVTVTGDAEVEAEVAARINTAGQVVEIYVISSGSGYTTTPIITISGGNGRNARAVAVLANPVVRGITTTIKYDRFEYTSQVVDWQPNTKYTEGQLVRYNDQVWSVDEVADSTEMDSGSIFDPEQYTKVDSATLSAANRVIGLYTPGPNEPGRELAQVIAGIDYPGVQVSGVDFNQNTGFDVGNYDINPYDNITYSPEGAPTYDPAILDAIYESSFLDPYLGTRATDINVEGGLFVDTYESHAPEELVPGITYDTLDFRVYTRPGADWEGNGHGFNAKSVNLEYSDTNDTVSFADVMAHATEVRVVNATTEVSLIPDQDYTVNWPARSVTVFNGASTGDVIIVQVYGVGGGNQLYKESYSGAVVGNALTVPVITTVTWQPLTTYLQGAYVVYDGNAYRVNANINSGTSFDPVFYTIVDIGSTVDSMLILVNGEIIDNYSWAPAANGYDTVISFDDTYTAFDWVVVTVLGITTPQKSWSMPVTQYFVYDGSTDIYTLTNSLQGTNNINLVVERNGERLRPAESVEYVADGSSAGPYYLPTRGEINQGLIADNDVVVYVDQVAQILSVDFTVSDWDGSSTRYVEFGTPPAEGSTVIVAVTTAADYLVNGDQLELRVGAATGSVFAVTTWNDTSDQDILTQVFVGPTTTGTIVGQPYDDTTFDQGNTSFDPGSFDYGIGTVVETNNFDTGRVITDASRLWVTLNGHRLIPGIDFTVSGTSVIVGGSIIGPADQVAITNFTMSVIPEAIAFRIFQDMRGNQKIYRITPQNTTVLTQALSATDDVIYVLDASDLNQPNPAQNIFGQITINGERITYRTRDLVNNTVSGLRRGTLGTAADSHAVDSAVIDIGIGEMLPARYQRQVIANEFIGDGSNKTFVTDISFDNPVTVQNAGIIRVYAGPTIGTLVELAQSEYTITDLEPITAALNIAPDGGTAVRIGYTSPLGMVTNTDFLASGSSTVFETNQNVTTLTVTNYDLNSVDPVTVEFYTPISLKQAVIISDLSASEFYIGDGSTTVYATTIELSRPVQVVVGGTLLAESAYTVSSITPITVTTVAAPADKLDVEIYIQQAQVMYAQGIGTASNGRPLQEQPTLAAWFIEGRV